MTTAKRWADRYRAHCRVGMFDRSCLPRSSPQQTPLRVERRAVGLRVTRRWGPATIAYHLRSQGLAPPTVHKILLRFQCPPLALTRPPPALGPADSWWVPRSYTCQAPGDLVQLDIEEAGRIPDGGGHKVLGRQAGRRDRRNGMGYWHIHNAVDDHSRLVYSDLLTHERKETDAAFWRRARAYFAAAGISVARMMADNGPCYRARVFNAALGEQVSHRLTRPHRSHTDGQVERFNCIPLEEWAYTCCYTVEAERTAAFRRLTS